AYISSGTWSLMGIETEQPILTDSSFNHLFTNEGGVGQKVRFLKNISGLWLLQECKRIWDLQEVTDYAALVQEATDAEPLRSVIDPDDPAFLNPPDMPEAIRGHCRRNGQPEPRTKGEFARCILESLALKYRLTLDQLREVSPHPIEKIHLIGGGSLNRLLCQLTADATGLPVIAGPAEATALGNILVQIASHTGKTDLPTLRGIALNSVNTITYTPQT
ncbi:MAG: FGGY-family carbohydrate kinase, partial [Bacteroidales bacterium]